MKKATKTRKKKIWGFIISLALFFLVFRVYWIPGVEVTVIDAETKEPIEGVVFLGYWEKYSGSFAGSNPSGILEVKELITDKNGKASFSGWIEVMPRIYWIEGQNGTGGVYATYKHGYSDRNGTFRFKNGEVVSLPKYEGALEDYWKKSGFSRVYNKVQGLFENKCIWKEIPRSVLADLSISLMADSSIAPRFSDLELQPLDRMVKRELNLPDACITYEEFKEEYF